MVLEALFRVFELGGAGVGCGVPASAGRGQQDV